MSLRHDGYFCDKNRSSFEKCSYFTASPLRKPFILKRLLTDQSPAVIQNLNIFDKTNRLFPAL
jgi:hypothetical protein